MGAIMATEYTGEVMPAQEYTGEVITETMPWSKVATESVSNIVPSVFGLVQGVAGAIAHPIDTVSGVMDVAAGGLQNLLPKGLTDYLNQQFPSKSAEEARAKADAVGKFYLDRYGSVEGFKRALAKDPAGVAADAATMLAGGAGLARAAGLQAPAQALTRASRAVDPLLQTVKGVEAAARPVGRGVSEIIGGMGTHTGGESIRQMAQAGYEGGQKAATAAAMMRDKGSVSDLLAKADAALANLRKQRASEYTNAMRQVSADRTVLNFTDVDSAVNAALDVKMFKGKSISPSTGKVQQQIADMINDWKQQNPADFHTAEGLDALKQSIGDIRDATEFGTPSRSVADKVYNAVKSEIVKQAPDYAKAMKDYSEASELISEIQRHLLGKEKGSPVTAARKLQSLLSASGKNKQLEMNLVKQLEQAGAPDLMSGLSGLSLQGIAPRGLAGQAGIGLGGLAFLTGNPMLGAPYLAMQSPRLMGEAALAAGKGAGMLRKTTDMGRNLTSGAMGQMPYDLYLYQMNQLREQGDKGMLETP